MKNKKGFTLIELLGVLIIIAMLLIIAVPTVSRYIKKGENAYYTNLEKTIMLAGREYLNEYKSLYPRQINHVTVIQLDELLGKYISSVVDKNKKACDARMTVKKVKNGYEYYTCLICDDYKSSKENCKFSEEDNEYEDKGEYRIEISPKEFVVEQGDLFNLPEAKVYHNDELVENPRININPRSFNTNTLGENIIKYSYNGVVETVKVTVIDKTKPTTPTVSLKNTSQYGSKYNGDWTNTNIYHSFLSVDYAKNGILGSGIAKYIIDKTPTFSSANTKVITNGNSIITTDGDGEYTYYVKSVDKSGNESDVVSYNIKIDKTSPLVNASVNKDVISFRLQDNIGVVKYYVWTPDDEQNMLSTPNALEETHIEENEEGPEDDSDGDYDQDGSEEDFDDDSGVEDYEDTVPDVAIRWIDIDSTKDISLTYKVIKNGSYTVYAKDIAGNISKVKFAYIDITPPTKPVVTLKYENSLGNIYSSGWSSKNIYQEFLSTDESGIKTYLVDMGSGYVDIRDNYQITNLNGEHTFKVKSVDNYGNESEEVEYSFKIDKTKPTVGVSVDKKVITFRLQDNIGVVKYGIKKPNSTSINWQNISSTLDTTLTYTADVSGVYTIYVEDVAGNQNSEQTENIDATPPTKPMVTLKLDNSLGGIYDGNWTNHDIYQKFTSTDESGIKTYMVDMGHGYIDIDSDYQITALNGIHTYKVKSIDMNDNESEEVEYSFKIDKSAPTIPEVELTMGSIDGELYYSRKEDNSINWSNEEIFHQYKSSDISGIKTYLVSLDDEEYYDINDDDFYLYDLTYRVLVDEEGNVSIIESQTSDDEDVSDISYDFNKKTLVKNLTLTSDSSKNIKKIVSKGNNDIIALKSDYDNKYSHYYVKAVDNNGNISEAREYEFYIDTTLPVASVNGYNETESEPDQDGMCFMWHDPMSMMLTDNVSGITSYAISDSSSIQPSNFTSIDSTLKYEITNIQNFTYENGNPIQKYIWVKDEAGNVSSTAIEMKKQLNSYKCKIPEQKDCVPEIKEVSFDYTGGEQVYQVLCDGVYKLETWGAQGGNLFIGYTGGKSTKSFFGGFGGYSTGEVELKQGDKLYIYVGEKPNGLETFDDYHAFHFDGGGYNGGDGCTGLCAAGGGATHIALNNARGQLKNYENYKNEVLIASGGGGGPSSTYSVPLGYNYTNAGNAGGSIGSPAEKFSYVAGYNFGQGEYVSSGGGWVAGVNRSAGGSSYIGNNSLKNKVMYCYNCKEDVNASQKTVSTTTNESVSKNLECEYKFSKKIETTVNTTTTITRTISRDTLGASNLPISNCAKADNGYAKITYVGAPDYENNYPTFVETIIDNSGYELFTAKPSLYNTFEIYLNYDKAGLYRSYDTNSGEATYYFRGNVDNNYVEFNDQMWRIVRINEDGTVRLISQESVKIASGYLFSWKYANDRTYMYYSNGSYAKDALSKLHLSSKYMAKSYFCEEAKYGTSAKEISSKDDLVQIAKNTSPTFRCKKDGNGYGLYESEIGLITLDELWYAGGFPNDYNDNINKKISYYSFLDVDAFKNGTCTMSPAGFNGTAYVWCLRKNGKIGGNIPSNSTGYLYINPVINIHGNVLVSGTGKSNDPYKIIGFAPTKPEINIKEKWYTVQLGNDSSNDYHRVMPWLRFSVSDKQGLLKATFKISTRAIDAGYSAPSYCEKSGTIDLSGTEGNVIISPGSYNGELYGTDPSVKICVYNLDGVSTCQELDLPLVVPDDGDDEDD